MLTSMTNTVMNATYNHANNLPSILAMLRKLLQGIPSTFMLTVFSCCQFLSIIVQFCHDQDQKTYQFQWRRKENVGAMLERFLLLC